MAGQKVNPFAFEPGTSWLAHLHPLAKMIFLLGVTPLIMNGTLPVLTGLALVALLLQWGLPRHSGASIVFVLWLSLFAALVRGALPGDGRLFDEGTLVPSGLYALRLVTVFLYSRAFYATTRIAEIGDWITAGWRTVQRLAGQLLPQHQRSQPEPGAITQDPGMLVTLTLLFLPRIFDLYRRIQEAGEIRGINLRRGNVQRSISMLQRLVLAGMRQAWRTSLAMEVRAYSPGRALRLRHFSFRDWLVMALPLLLALLF